MVLGVEGEVFKLHGAAVETHEVAFLAHYRCKLVHDAAVHAAVIMLGRLTDACKFEFIYLVVVEEFVDSECEARFEGGRRAEACTKRNIAGEYGVEAMYCAAAFEYLAAYAEDIAGP